MEGFLGNNQQIARQHRSSTVALNTAVGTTAAIDTRGASGGAVFVPAGSSITSLTYHAAPYPNGTYLPLYKEDGSTAVTQTVQAGRAYDLPAACAGVGSLKIVTNAAGNVELSLKG